MATLSSYGIDTFYETGFGYSASSVLTGQQTISFFRALSPGTSRPIMYEFDADAAALADAVTIDLNFLQQAEEGGTPTAATGKIVLRRGDILNFGTESAPNPVVINQDIAIDSAAATTVSILPLISGVALAAKAYSYALMPLQFVETGGSFDNASDIATAQNKSIGYWSLKAVTGRNATLTLSGALITQDPSVYALSKLNDGGRYLYYEIRYHPYTRFTYLADNGTATEVKYGSGPQAKKATCTSNFKMTMDKTDMVKVEATLEACGRPEDYVLLSTNSAEVTAIAW
jgi:hypothetical protein